MDLKEFHDTVRYFLNKEQGGWLTPEEIDNIADRAQMWWFNESLPFYGKNQKSTDALSPFVVKYNFITNVTGIVTLPNNYESLLSATIVYFDDAGARNRYKTIKILSEDNIAERRDSQILEPTVSDPVGIEHTPGIIQIYPDVPLEGYAYYFRRPVKPVFIYTQTGRTIIYDNTTSTQLEWTEASLNKILIKTIQMFGVNLSDEMIIQFTELKNTQDI